ncbi:MAG: 3-keto-5-aminohexanoate cleavage protein [Deltaproteobacteria bacterium]|nr:3-keto-5-aminohexanoate cleavage protein [Deltaproteobacteria bacterium]
MSDENKTGMPDLYPPMEEMIAELEKRREKIRAMGGPEAVEKQHSRNKLTARERIDLLFDPGTFTEVMMHGHHQSTNPMMQGRETPADGVITGFGEINGRLACCGAYDFTVMAGSMGMIGEMKMTRLRQWALARRVPFVWLLDSAGARVQEATGSQFAGSGGLFYEEVQMSGVIPLVAAVMGPCSAGTAYIPGLSDFVPMVKGNASMALAGIHLVRAATGEEITEEELGGSRVHTQISGCADIEVKDDRECIDIIKKYLSFFPLHCEDEPPRVEPTDAPDRAEDELVGIVPTNPRKPFDVRRVIELIADDGEVFEIKPKWARAIVCALARMDGYPVGFIASQPKAKGAVLDNDSSDKAARFISLCDAFNIPLVFLQDVPGFMVGKAVEHAGIIRHGAKFIFAMSDATVPKITVVLRKAYGAGYFAMCGREFGADAVFAWPTAEISVMGPEGAVNIMGRRMIEAADDKEAMRSMMLAEFKKMIDVYIAGGWSFVDDVIDPRETRSKIIRALHLARTKRVERPRKKARRFPGIKLDEDGIMRKAFSDDVVITCAMSGVIAGRNQCPAIPYTVEEYAEEARRAFEAGAAVLHIHARNDDGSPSYSPDRYAAIADGIRAKVPDIILNFSTGAIQITKEEKIAPVIHYKPDIAALNMGTMNYAKYSSKRKDFVFEFQFINPIFEISFLLTKMKENGVRAEMECFDSGHVSTVYPLIDQGLLEPPFQFSFIMGVVGGMDASIETMAQMKRLAPEGSIWEVIGISHEQWRLLAGALALGGNIRVGLEDHFYTEPGVMASSNGDLVAKAARMAGDAGRKIVQGAEARSALGLT